VSQVGQDLLEANLLDLNPDQSLSACMVVTFENLKLGLGHDHGKVDH